MNLSHNRRLLAGFGRKLGSGKGGAVSRYGRKSKYKLPEIKEKAILRALEWLKNEQNKDGSWGRGYPVPVTSLALLAFLSHQETQFSAQYGSNVDEAIRYLGRKAESNEAALLGTNIRTAYQHGLATYALTEAYALTRSYRLLNSAKNSVNLIIKTQGPNGGWTDYYDQPKPDNLGNTSITGWQVMALRTASRMGFNGRQTKDALKRSANYLQRVYGNPGFGLYKPGSRFDLDGIGALSLQLSGQTRSYQVTQTLNSLKDYDLAWDEQADDVISGYYFITQAMHYAGLSYWDDWNKKMTSLLLENQNEDGSWSLPAKSTENAFLGRDADTYSTALCALILEIEYRSLVISAR